MNDELATSTMEHLLYPFALNIKMCWSQIYKQAEVTNTDPIFFHGPIDMPNLTPWNFNENSWGTTWWLVGQKQQQKSSGLLKSILDNEFHASDSGQKIGSNSGRKIGSHLEVAMAVQVTGFNNMVSGEASGEKMTPTLHEYSIIPDSFALQIKSALIHSGGNHIINLLKRIKLSIHQNGDQLHIIPLDNERDDDNDDAGGGGSRGGGGKGRGQGGVPPNIGTSTSLINRAVICFDSEVYFSQLFTMQH